MSTTTNFKRIALVAVAALGLGVLSSVPSQAAVNAAAVITTAPGSATITNSDSVTAATVAVRYFAEANTDTATITFTLGTKPATATAATADLLISAVDTALASGFPTVLAGKDGTTGAWAAPYGTDSVTADTANGKITPGGAGNAYGKFRVFLDTRTVRVAGTYTVDYQVKIFSGGTLAPSLGGTGSVNIVVTDGSSAAAGAVAVAGTSTAVFSTGASFAPAVTGVDDAVAAVVTPDGTARGVLRVTLKTSAGLPAQESVTVTTTVGNIGTSQNTSGKSLTVVGNANGVNDFNLYSDGTSGTAVITVKSTSVTFANKSATFYSTVVDRFTVTVLGKVIGSSSADALLVKAFDATGNQIKESTNSTVYAYSDALTVINTGATTGTLCGNYSDVTGGQICALTGANPGTANITIRDKSTVAASTKASTPVALTVNTNPAVKVALSFNKATYAPGEAAYISVRATDIAGNPVGPNTGYGNLLATGGITSSVSFGNGSASAESMTATTLPLNYATTGFPTDVALYTVKVFMPASGGTVSVSATGGTALPAANQVAITATATITDSGAAALAAVTALATTVASLRTLIVTLTNLVLKIQKKVRA